MWNTDLITAVGVLNDYLDGKEICLKRVYPVYQGIVFETTYEYEFFYSLKDGCITEYDLKEEEPMVVFDSVPSSPEGQFRIGKEWQEED